MQIICRLVRTSKSRSVGRMQHLKYAPHACEHENITTTVEWRNLWITEHDLVLGQISMILHKTYYTWGQLNKVTTRILLFFVLQLQSTHVKARLETNWIHQTLEGFVLNSNLWTSLEKNKVPTYEMDTCSYSTEPTLDYTSKFPLQRQDNSKRGNWFHEKPLGKAATDSSISVTACQQRQLRLTTIEQLMNGFFVVVALSVQMETGIV